MSLWRSVGVVLFLSFLNLLAAPAANASEQLTVLTYNAGLLNKVGVDFVPCVTPRTAVQAREVFRVIEARKTPHFVIGLQEVWTQDGYNSYVKLAKHYGYTYTPASYPEVQNNGEMIITNVDVTSARFIPFQQDSNNVQRGFRIFELKLSASKTIEYIDLHTSYSDSLGYSKTHLSQLVDLANLLDAEHKRFKGDLIVGGDFNAGPNLHYTNERYDPSKVLWTDWIAQMFGARHFNEATYDGNTWDEANSLVSNAATIIKIVNFSEYGVAGWEEQSSKLDHVFISNQGRVLNSHVVLNEPVVAPRCDGWSNALGEVPLSDHYALLTELEL